MFYKSYADLVRDIKLKIVELPPICAVYGIPRSGVPIASIIALHLNCQLILDLQQLPTKPWLIEGSGAGRTIPPREGRVLIVDDTVCNGHKIIEVKNQLPPGDYCFFAYTIGKDAQKYVDHYCHQDNHNEHLFEWCIFHHLLNGELLSDLDGVFCPNWPHGYEEDDKEQEYLQFLENAPCLLRPTMGVRGIVTARLHKHRTVTEMWLEKNGIKCNELIMCDANSTLERDSNDMGTKLKIETYRNSSARIFVESEPGHSMVIAAQTHKPVLSWREQILYS